MRRRPCWVVALSWLAVPPLAIAAGAWFACWLMWRAAFPPGGVRRFPPD